MEFSPHEARVEKDFEAQRLSQLKIRDEQADSYVSRYLRRGPTFVQFDERVMLSMPQFSPEQRVLDAGSGVGYFALKIAPLVKWVDAFDFSAPSLQLLEKNAAAAGITNVRPLCGDLMKVLPYADQSFDRIISHQVLSYLPPELLPAILDEFYRVLKPGGNACFSLFKFGWRGHFRNQKFDNVNGFFRYSYSIDEVEQLASRSRFGRHQLRGLVNTPAFLREFSDRIQFVRPSVVGLEVGISSIPWSIYTGHYLMVQLFK